MITFLMFVLCLIAIMQKSISRGFVIGLFVFVSLLHSSIESLGVLDGGVYYVSAALFNVGYIYALSKIEKTTTLIMDLQLVSGVAFIINFFGFLCWYFYLPTDPYKLIFPIVHVLALLAVVKKDIDNARGLDNFRVLGMVVRTGSNRDARSKLHTDNEG